MLEPGEGAPSAAVGVREPRKGRRDRGGVASDRAAMLGTSDPTHIVIAGRDRRAAGGAVADLTAARFTADEVLANDRRFRERRNLVRRGGVLPALGTPPLVVAPGGAGVGP